LSEEQDIYTFNSFIYYYSPHNFTIQISVLNKENGDQEDIDVVRIEDTQKFTFNDGIIRMTTFKNNAKSFNLSLSEVLNNFVISFNEYSQRTKSIIIMNNTMMNMNDASEDSSMC
jgi:hypothetical protein